MVRRTDCQKKRYSLFLRSLNDKAMSTVKNWQAEKLIFLLQSSQLQLLGSPTSIKFTDTTIYPPAKITKWVNNILWINYESSTQRWHEPFFSRGFRWNWCINKLQKMLSCQNGPWSKTTTSTAFTVMRCVWHTTHDYWFSTNKSHIFEDRENQWWLTWQETCVRWQCHVTAQKATSWGKSCCWSSWKHLNSSVLGARLCRQKGKGCTGNDFNL